MRTDGVPPYELAWTAPRMFASVRPPSTGLPSVIVLPVLKTMGVKTLGPTLSTLTVLPDVSLV